MMDSRRDDPGPAQRSKWHGDFPMDRRVDFETD
jgi:hypothetical protein